MRQPLKDISGLISTLQDSMGYVGLVKLSSLTKAKALSNLEVCQVLIAASCAVKWIHSKHLIEILCKQILRGCKHPIKKKANKSTSQRAAVATPLLYLTISGIGKPPKHQKHRLLHPFRSRSVSFVLRCQTFSIPSSVSSSLPPHSLSY